MVLLCVYQKGNWDVANQFNDYYSREYIFYFVMFLFGSKGNSLQNCRIINKGGIMGIIQEIEILRVR